MVRLDSRRRSGTKVKLSCQGRVRAMPCFCLLHPAIRLTNEENSLEKKPHSGMTGALPSVLYMS